MITPEYDLERFNHGWSNYNNGKFISFTETLKHQFPRVAEFDQAELENLFAINNLASKFEFSIFSVKPRYIPKSDAVSHSALILTNSYCHNKEYTSSVEIDKSCREKFVFQLSTILGLVKDLNATVPNLDARLVSNDGTDLSKYLGNPL